MSETRQHHTSKAEEHGDDPENILIHEFPAEPLHTVAVTVFLEFRPRRNSVFCFVKILHGYLSRVRCSISDPLFPQTARACRGKPVVKSSDGMMAG